MKKRITRLAVMQTGKLLAALYACLSIVLLPFMLIGILANPKNFPVLLTLPLYPVFGFIAGILMAVLYNFAAKWVGGIEVSVEAIETESPNQL